MDRIAGKSLGVMEMPYIDDLKKLVLDTINKMNIDEPMAQRALKERVYLEKNLVEIITKAGRVDLLTFVEKVRIRPVGGITVSEKINLPENFEEEFVGKFNGILYEETFVKISKLQRMGNIEEMYNFLGTVSDVIIPVHQMLVLLEKQANGENGPLSLNSSNIFVFSFLIGSRKQGGKRAFDCEYDEKGKEWDIRPIEDREWKNVNFSQGDYIFHNA